MLKELLRKVAKEDAKYGGRLQPPAKPKELGRMRQDALERLGYEIPEDYVDFLEIADGLDYDGIVLFGSSSKPMVDKPDLEIEGFMDANERMRKDMESADQYIFFGTDNDEVLAFGFERQEFLILDEVSFDPLENYYSYAVLVAAVLKKRFAK